jgi:hypothetical protein
MINDDVRHGYHQIGERAMETLRVHARRLLVNVLAGHAVRVMGKRIVKIAFGKKAKKAKKKKRGRNELLYGGMGSQQSET